MAIYKYKNNVLKKKVHKKFGGIEKTYYLCTRKKEMMAG